MEYIKPYEHFEESPLITIIKLNSAEEGKKYDEALKYIDVNSVYDEYAKEENNNALDLWKEKIEIQYNLGQDKKFNNNFCYYEYDIIEIINNQKAIVTFKNKNSKASIKEIVYMLSYTNNKWIVMKIEYKN